MEPGFEDEDDVPDETAVDEEIAKVAASLYTDHLPMLADAGFIRWDKENDVIRRGPEFDALRPLLERLQLQHNESLDTSLESDDDPE